MSLVDDIKALQANLIPDNTNNEISPKDVRDAEALSLDNWRQISEEETGDVFDFSTYAKMTAKDGIVDVVYRVLNDTDSSKNGYYHWNESIYVKDADLANGVIENGNVDAISGGTAYKLFSNTGILNGLNSTTPNIKISPDRKFITFGKNGFSYIKSGVRYNIFGTNDKVIENVFATRLYLYLDESKLATNVNWDVVTDLFIVSSEVLRTDMTLLSVAYAGFGWSPVGLLNNIINESHQHSKTSLALTYFLDNNIAENIIKIDTFEKTITFPKYFTVEINKISGAKTTLQTAQTISLICTDINDTPVASSQGYLIINNKTNKITNLFFHDYNTNNYTSLSDNDFTLIGYVKRSTGSLTEIGDVQLSSNLIYEIDGSKSYTNERDLLLRNLDIKNKITASSYNFFNDNQHENLQLLTISDVHNDNISIRNASVLINHFTTIDGGILLGDTLASNFTNDFTFADKFLRSGKPVLHVLGNHDVGQSKIVANCGSNTEVYNRFIQPYETEIGGVHTGKNYYYKDFTNHKIRVIVLYEYDDPNDLDTDPSLYKITRGYRVLSQAQLNWFVDTLHSTPLDHSVVIALHQTASASMTYEDSNFSSNITLAPIMNFINGFPIEEIVDAFINGTDLTKSYNHFGEATYLPDVNVNASFSTRGTGNFICYLGGHTHCDGILHINAFPNQKQIIVANAGASVYYGKSDLKRVPNTKSEDAINVVSFDTNNRKINVVRIGADFTLNMTERQYTSIDY